MDTYNVFPDKLITPSGQVSQQFLRLGIDTFLGACRHVQGLPYGYNANRDDLMILFKEKMGSCTTKHAVIATLAAELDLPIRKSIGLYAMTEAIVSGTDRILTQYRLPYLPMVHCFLVYDAFRVDLTEGNANGKNRPIDDLLHAEPVIANISAKVEYLKYRQALQRTILTRSEFAGITIKTLLLAREEGLELLKANLKQR